MTLEHSDENHLVFRIGGREKEIFLKLLDHYPLVPAKHHQLSRDLPAELIREDQELLESALTEHRLENRRQLQAWLTRPETFRAYAQTDDGNDVYRFAIGRSECEWLLQVLNDLKVGSWLKLGSPDFQDEDLARLKIAQKDLRYVSILDLCNVYQSLLLHALGR